MNKDINSNQEIKENTENKEENDSYALKSPSQKYKDFLRLPDPLFLCLMEKEDQLKENGRPSDNSNKVTNINSDSVLDESFSDNSEKSMRDLEDNIDIYLEEYSNQGQRDSQKSEPSFPILNLLEESAKNGN
ncbi:MAG: hypothetical protein MJ252_20780 [archaeon]|nr:hypothetical protein [archaeon]